MDRWKGGQKDGVVARKATQTAVSMEKVTPTSILFDTDGHAAKTLSFLDKIGVSDAPDCAAKIPLKVASTNPTLSDRQPFMSFLS